uniref:Uncharacterized protein n=1 Tax=Arundo donax TaxID=35708 RepID=A0A0A9FS09_ARUDO
MGKTIHILMNREHVQHSDCTGLQYTYTQLSLYFLQQHMKWHFYMCIAYELIWPELHNVDCVLKIDLTFDIYTAARP